MPRALALGALMVAGGCGPINVHVFENVGKRDGLETRATDDGLQTRPTSDPRAKVKLLQAGEAAPWDDGLETSPTADSPAQERARAALLNALDGLNTALAAGTMKPNQLIGSLIGIARVLQLEEVDKPKVERDEEKHAAWMAEKSASLKQAVGEKTEGGKTLTREDVYDLVDSIMRGKA